MSLARWHTDHDNFVRWHGDEERPRACRYADNPRSVFIGPHEQFFRLRPGAVFTVDGVGDVSPLSTLSASATCAVAVQARNLIGSGIYAQVSPIVALMDKLEADGSG